MSANDLVMLIILILIILIVNYIVLRNAWEWWLGLESDKGKR